LVAQEYTITDNAVSYTVPVVANSECNFSYTFTVLNPDIGDAITCVGSTRTCTFFEMDSLALSGDSSMDHYIQVVAKNHLQTRTMGELRVTFRNPCIDENFFVIVSEVVMPQLVQYRLTDDLTNGFDIDAISLLSITTTPNESNLCMLGVTYALSFDG
jgi:hypothetical protein